MVQTQAPGFYRLKVGAVEVTALSDGTVPLPMPKIYKNIAEAEAENYLAERFQGEGSPISVNAFLVNTGERLVLIDAGTGELMGAALGKLTANIKASGYDPADIDDIILTHIHSDHSGGLTVNGKMLFEQATVHVNHRDEQFWLNADKKTLENKDLAAQVSQALACVGPYRDAGKLVAFGDNEEPVPGFKTILRAGHTPGHSSIVVESEGETIVFWGDIVHGDTLQFDTPTVTVDFDVDQEAAAATRATAFTEAADRKYLVAGAHHAFPGIGHVRRDETNYDWQPLVYSASY